MDSTVGRAARLSAALLTTAAASLFTPGVATADVPGVEQNVTAGQPCAERDTYPFGRDANGNLMACHWAQNAGTYLWDGPLAGPLMGVQNIGAPCNLGSAQVMYAQSPDGYGLTCAYGKWSRI